MNGHTKINDIVRTQDGKLHMVTNIDDSRFHSPDFIRRLSLKGITGAGGTYVDEEDTELVITARQYDSMRVRLEDLPDPRLQRF